MGCMAIMEGFRMSWEYIWTLVVQPVILSGLFTMTFISMIIAIRSVRKQLKYDEEEIHHNADEIQKLYNLVGQHLKAGEELKKTLKESDSTDKDYW